MSKEETIEAITLQADEVVRTSFAALITKTSSKRRHTEIAKLRAMVTDAVSKCYFTIDTLSYTQGLNDAQKAYEEALKEVFEERAKLAKAVVLPEPVAQFAEDFIFNLRKQSNGERWPVGTNLLVESEVREQQAATQLQAEAQIDALLERIDHLAEAGVCQMTAGGKDAFLKDIRAAIAAAKGVK